MANLTTEQAATLVDNGTIIRQESNSAYQFHIFAGQLDGETYNEDSIAAGLELDASSTEAVIKTAFKGWFKNQKYKGVAPVIDNTIIYEDENTNK